MTVAKQYKIWFWFSGVQDVWRDRCGTETSGEYIRSYLWKCKKIRGYWSTSELYQPIDRRGRWSSCRLLRVKGFEWSVLRIPTVVNLGFLDLSRYIFIQVVTQIISRGWVDPVSDPLLLWKSGSAGNRTRNLWICSQELWPPEHRGEVPMERYWNILFLHYRKQGHQYKDMFVNAVITVYCLF
jgi:hypothetical protein